METAGEALPDGWALANGQVLTSGNQDINPGGNWTTPDLRNRFILGADATKGVTTTSGSHTLPVSPITVVSTSGFPASGRLNLGTQIVAYTGVSGNTFTGVTGGTGVINAGTVVSYAGQSANHADANAAAGAPGVQGKGGSHEHLISTIAELPVHGHSHGNRTGTTAAENPSHTHTTSAAGSHAHTTGGGGGHNHLYPQSMHGVSGSTWFILSDLHVLLYAHGGAYGADSIHGIATDNHNHAHSTDATHSHPVQMSGGTTGTTGSASAAHENRAKFVACVWIVKVKR
jgi:hypothetical protein